MSLGAVKLEFRERFLVCTYHIPSNVCSLSMKRKKKKPKSKEVKNKIQGVNKRFYFLEKRIISREIKFKTYIVSRRLKARNLVYNKSI